MHCEGLPEKVLSLPSCVTVCWNNSPAAVPCPRSCIRRILVAPISGPRSPHYYNEISSKGAEQIREDISTRKGLRRRKCILWFNETNPELMAETMLIRPFIRWLLTSKWCEEYLGGPSSLNEEWTCGWIPGSTTLRLDVNWPIGKFYWLHSNSIEKTQGSWLLLWNN